MGNGTFFPARAIVAGLAGLSLWASTVDASVGYETVALTGDAAPGADPGVVFSGFDGPTINGNGQVVFRAALSGTGVDADNDTGIWSGDGGSLGLVVRASDPVPDAGPGVVFSGFNALIAFNDAGQAALNGFLTGPGVTVGVNNLGIWAGDQGGLRTAGRAGDAAPGADPGVVLGPSITFPILNNAGQAAFRTDLVGPGVNASNNLGIWSESGGSLNLVARTGDAAPGTEPGTVFGSFNVPVIDGSGQAAFRGSLTGTGIDDSNNIGIWAEDGGSLNLIARTGDAAPGTEPGTVFTRLDLGSPAVNRAGHIAFSGSLSSPLNTQGIWSNRSGSLDLIVRAGDAASDAGPGVVFSSISSAFIAVNATGQVAFGAFLSGTGVTNDTNYSLWAENNGVLNLIAREGDAAPGTGLGVVFSDLGSAGHPLFNDAGQAAFSGTLTGTGVDDSNDFGIWATDLDGVLTLIVREGDLFDVNDDPLIEEFRTIDTIEFLDFGNGSGGEDGKWATFNDAGQLAFKLNFTDGSEGIFVATIPEPGALVMLALGGSLIALRRRCAA